MVTGPKSSDNLVVGEWSGGVTVSRSSQHGGAMSVSRGGMSVSRSVQQRSGGDHLTGGRDRGSRADLVGGRLDDRQRLRHDPMEASGSVERRISIEGDSDRTRMGTYLGTYDTCECT
jgi:hypothetical protein